MDAAFDGPDDDDEEDHNESRGLLSRDRERGVVGEEVRDGRAGGQSVGRIPGEYDFHQDYVSHPFDGESPMVRARWTGLGTFRNCTVVLGCQSGQACA